MSNNEETQQDAIDAKIKARLDAFGALTGKYVYGSSLVE